MKDETKEEKNELQWHRTFNNQNITFTTTMVVVVIAWLAATIILSGVIFWILSKMI